MVQSINNGNKTKTRRTRGLEFINVSPDDWSFTGWQRNPVLAKTDKKGEIYPKEVIGTYAEFNMGEMLIKCPYEIGDVIWVRETFLILEPDHCMGGVPSKFVYKADSDPDTEEARKDYIQIGYPYQWKPGIHMPKTACRIFLQIASVRCERLQYITEEDAISEGVESRMVNGKVFLPYMGYKNYFSTEYDDPLYFKKASSSFISLWQSINGPDSWDLNPYVWVIEFEKCEKPDNFI